MSTDDTYQGWKNRETWALNLWLTNDQGLYEMTRERVSQALAAAILPGWAVGTAPGEFDVKRWKARAAGEAVKDFYDELTDPSEGLMTPENILVMVKDVGSDYRVDWDEIGAYWISDLDES